MQSLLDFLNIFVEPFNRLREQFAAVMAPLFAMFVILIIGGAFAYLVRRGGVPAPGGGDVRPAGIRRAKPLKPSPPPLLPMPPLL